MINNNHIIKNNFVSILLAINFCLSFSPFSIVGKLSLILLFLLAALRTFAFYSLIPCPLPLD